MEDRKSKMPTPLLTVQELAALFKVDKRTIWRWKSNGTIPQPVRIGSISRWRCDDIERLVTTSGPKQGGK